MNTHHSPYDIDVENYDKTLFGFWLYILTDFIMFATIFATYVVLYGTHVGTSGKEIFNLPLVLIQTLILLFSSFTAGLGGAAAHKRDKKMTILLFGLTFLLGLFFMVVEGISFNQLIKNGFMWHKNGFLSGYFTLVGTHGLHMLFALLWVLVLLPPVFRKGLTGLSIKRLTCLRMFWQFLNIVWVFIFTVVYLIGVL
jgi:cytochrome o ubiquinol oxidase subunit 3